MAAKTKKKVSKSHRLSKIVSRPRTRGKIWVMAVDPFSQTDLQPLWNLAKPLSDRAGARMQAAYVLAPASMNWTGEFNGHWMKKYQPIAEEKLREKLPAEGIERTVILCKESGLRASANALIQYANKQKADCIVIATHARSGLERIALGSFAETVILTSKIPVLVVNPEHKLPNSVRRILVPTDLSRGSQKFLSAVVDYAKSLEAEIVLFHKQDDPLDPIVQQGVYALGGGWMSTQSYMDTAMEEKTKEIEKIETMIRKRNVTVSHIFDSSPGGLIESIDRAAQDTGSDMVSVLTKSGSWSATLLGSVARELVRHSSVPILVRR